VALGHAVLLVELLDHLEIISVVRVPLVEDAESASAFLVMLGAVVTVVLLFELRRENGPYLACQMLRDFVSQEHGYHTKDPKVSNTWG
jgi:hypothetical protein